MPKEVLEKAIQKAIDGGWRHQVIAHPELFTSLEISDAIGRLQNHPNDFIFDHDFARALWGDDLIFVKNGCAIEDPYDEDEEVSLSPYWRSHHLNSWTYDIPVWAFHLTKMVIAEDPIKYLGDNI